MLARYGTHHRPLALEPPTEVDVVLTARSIEDLGDANTEIDAGAEVLVSLRP